MKRLVFISIILLCFETLYGQFIWVGMQGGIDYKMISDNNTTIASLSGNKGVFISLETKNGWLFETNVNHTQYTDAVSPIIWDCCWGCETQNIAGRRYSDQLIHNKFDVITANSVAQHKITSKKSIILDYIGLNAGITRVYKKETTDYVFSDDPSAQVYNRSSYSHKTDIHMGISNTLLVVVGKNLFVRNTISAYANPFKLTGTWNRFPEFDAMTTFQCSFGIGYLFK